MRGVSMCLGAEGRNLNKRDRNEIDIKRATQLLPQRFGPKSDLFATIHSSELIALCNQGNDVSLLILSILRELFEKFYLGFGIVLCACRWSTVFETATIRLTCMHLTIVASYCA